MASAKKRYEKSPHVSLKDGGKEKGEKVEDKKPDAGGKEAPPKAVKGEDGPSRPKERHPSGGAPSGDAPTGTEESSIPIHARHAMERDHLYHQHAREHAEMHGRHEREHMAAMHGGK